MRSAGCLAAGSNQHEIAKRNALRKRRVFPNKRGWKCRDAPTPTLSLRLPFQLLTLRPFSSKLPTHETLPALAEENVCCLSPSISPGGSSVTALASLYTLSPVFHSGASALGRAKPPLKDKQEVPSQPFITRYRYP